MMTTQEIMELAMEMSQLEVEPADSGIYVEGNGIKNVFFGIDIGVEELLWAKQQGLIGHSTSSTQCSTTL